MGQQLVYYICAVSVSFASTLLGPSRRGLFPLSYALRTFSPRSWPAGDFFPTAEAARKKSTSMYPPPPPHLAYYCGGAGVLYNPPPVVIQSTVPATLLGMIGVDQALTAGAPRPT